MKNKVWFSILLIFGVFVILSCSKAKIKKDSLVVSAPGEFPIVKEPLTLNILVGKKDVVENWQTNEASKLMEKLTGIKMEYSVAAENVLQDLNLAVASDDIPDIIMDSSISSINMLGLANDGVLADMAPILDKQAPNIQAMFKDQPWIEKVITTPEGHVWSLPEINDDFHAKYGPKLWINQTWLNALDLELPTTIEEFYSVLVAFKEQDPNGNGKADEIPLSYGTYSWLGHPFIVYFNALMASFVPFGPFKLLYLDQGKVQFSYAHPGYKDYLHFMHRLYEEKLMDPAALTQDIGQLKTLGENPGASILGAAGSGWGWWEFTINGGESGRYKEYTLVPPLKGPYGDYAAYDPYRVLNFPIFMITSRNPEPTASVKWADYLYSPEGGYNTQFGPEGIGWVRPPEGATSLEGGKALFLRKNTISTKDKNTLWGFGSTPKYQPASQRLGEMKKEDIYDPSALMTRLIGEVKPKYEGHELPLETILPPVFVAADNAQELSTLEVDLHSYVDENSLLFIRGDKDIDAEWQDFLDDLEQIGLPRYLEIYQQAYDAQWGQ